MVLPSGASAKLNSETGEERRREGRRKKRANEKGEREEWGRKRGVAKKKKVKGGRRRAVSRRGEKNKCVCVRSVCVCVYDCVLLETSCQPSL